MDDLRNTVINLKPDIVACTETWFNNDLLDDYINVNGYDIFRCDRLNRMGGGVCVWIKSTLNADASDLCKTQFYFCEGIESVWICIETYNLLFGCVYLPPVLSASKKVIDNLINCVDTLLNAHVNYHPVICADFNSADIEYINMNLSTVSIVTTPTRNEKTIDQIIVSKFLIDSIENVSILPPLCNLTKGTQSDHNIIHISTKNVIQTAEYREIKCFDFRENNIANAKI